jgi:4-hydroxy-tetrahydrodipicolinate synthase
MNPGRGIGGVLKGVYIVLVTPFGSDGRVDLESINKNVDWQISQGIDGVVATGSTGEFVGLEDVEREQISEAVVRAAAGRVPVFIGTSAESTEKVIANSRLVKKMGADGVMVLPSYYCKPNQEEIYAHFACIADSVDMPVIIYNNPGTTGVDIKAETAARMFRYSRNLATIKECTGDMRRIREIRLLIEDRMNVFCGWEDLAYESFVMGARGWISVIGNVAPRMAKELFDLAYEQKDLGGAWKVYLKLLPMLGYLEYWGNAPQILKYCLGKMGLAGGPVRSPRLPLSDEQKRILDETCVLRGSSEFPREGAQV